jgi:hypothetical protein
MSDGRRAIAEGKRLSLDPDPINLRQRGSLCTVRDGLISDSFFCELACGYQHTPAMLHVIDPIEQSQPGSGFT